ncbi:hypothetical protein MXB_3467 [Myxobolus squamalis]|nr:hypothetical protein MXB_3467 [Myxobolus squamalis]
MLQERLPAQS